MKKLLLALAFISTLGLSACGTDSQNQYSESDVGHSVDVDYGKIVAMREVRIQGENSGLGAVAGGAAGAGAGNAVTYGNGHGNAVGVIGGAVVGAVVGGIAEQQLKNRKGIEYTIKKANGKTVMIVQNIAKDDVPLHVGQHVMIQTTSDYQRVLPAN